MRNALRSISTELEVSTLRFTRVGLLLAVGDETHTISWEFPNPLTQDAMITYVDIIFSTGVTTVLGFIAFTVGGTGLLYLNSEDVDVEDEEAIIADLDDAFNTEGHAVTVIQDPTKGPCIVVPDDNGEPDFGWVN